MFINVFGIVCQMKTSLPAAWTDAHKQKTWRWVNACKWSSLEFPLNNATTRVVAKNVFLMQNQMIFPHGKPRVPIFCQRLPRSWFFRESILRGNRQALWIFCDLLKLLLCAGHRLYRRWAKQVSTLTAHFNWFFNKDILQGRRTIAHLWAFENRAFENHMVLSLLEFSLAKT